MRLKIIRAADTTTNATGYRMMMGAGTDANNLHFNGIKTDGHSVGAFCRSNFLGGWELLMSHFLSQEEGIATDL